MSHTNGFTVCRHCCSWLDITSRRAHLARVAFTSSHCSRYFSASFYSMTGLIYTWHSCAQKYQIHVNRLSFSTTRKLISFWIYCTPITSLPYCSLILAELRFSVSGSCISSTAILDRRVCNDTIHRAATFVSLGQQTTAIKGDWFEENARNSNRLSLAIGS